MHMLFRAAWVLLAIGAASAASAQTYPVSASPEGWAKPTALCLQTVSSKCALVASDNPIPVLIVGGGGGGGGGTGDASAANQATQITAANLTNTRLGDITTPAAGSVNARLAAILAALGNPFQVGSLIGNTAFGATQSGSWTVGLTGTLPAFASTPTFNLGALNGAATSAKQDSLLSALGTPFQAGGAIGNTVFGATQSGTWTTQIGAAGVGGSSSNPLFITSTATPSSGAAGSTAPTNAQQEGGRTAAGNLVPFCVSTSGALCAPVAGTAQSTGTVTSLSASTSTTVCPATTNPVTYEVQIYGTGPVLLGLDGQALTAITPAAGSGAYMLLPTQYTLYVGPVARTNAITAWTATAQTIVCNIIGRL